MSYVLVLAVASVLTAVLPGAVLDVGTDQFLPVPADFMTRGSLPMAAYVWLTRRSPKRA